MNHIAPLRSTLADFMDTAATPQDRARRIAAGLDAMLDRGDFARLNSHQLVCLRGVVWALAAIADDLHDAEAARAPVRTVAPARWWRW